jgi:hypothetical protein
MTQKWPVAELDPIRRLRVMAASLPAVAHAETIVPAPLEQVWAAAADLEASMPILVRDFRTVRVTELEAGRLRMDARGKLGQRARFDVVLQPGWCWMQSRLWVGGIAAVEQPGPSPSTRIGFLGGLRIPGAELAMRALRSTGQELARQALTRLADQIARDARGA